MAGFSAKLWGTVVVVVGALEILVHGLECGYPGSPAFGRPNPVRETYRPGDAVSFTCASGYSLYGPMKRTCSPNGTWIGRLPLCDRSLSSLDRQASSRETLILYPAKNVIDGDPATCTYTDKRKPRWIRVDMGSNHRVRAVAITVPKGIYANNEAHLTFYVISVQDSTTASYHKCASFNGKFSTDTLKLSCSRDEIEGRYIHVNDDRDKLDYFSLCEIQIFVNRGSYDCGETERPAHALAVRTETGAISYRCIYGYRLEGPSKRFCLQTGQWSSYQPICREIVCPPVTPVEYGRIHYLGPNRGYPVKDTVVNVTCDYGYHAIGTPLKCEDNGHWSKGNLSCQPINCGMPSVKQRKEQYFLLNGTTTYGSVVLFRCGDKEAIRTCREDGTWSIIDVECTQHGLTPLELIEEEESNVPLGIVIGMAVVVFILLVLVVFVLVVKRKNLLRRNSTDSLPSKETGSSIAPSGPQQYENDAFYASIPADDSTSCKRNYMSTILFTKKKPPPRQPPPEDRKDSIESSIGSCIYEEIGARRSQRKKSRSVTPCDTDTSQPVYAQVDLDEKRRSRLAKSYSEHFEPVDPPQWEGSYRSEEAPSFDDVDLEPIKLRELPPVPSSEETDSVVTYASLALPLEPPTYMRNNEIYEESVPNEGTVMKRNDVYLTNSIP